MNTIGYFEIQAAHPDIAIDFYAHIFGWGFSRDTHIPLPYYRITGSGMMGALLQRPADTPPIEYGTNAFTCSIQVESYDQTAAKILEKGGNIAMEKFAVPGKCWQGYFLDTENNVFGIFETNEDAK